MGRPKGSPNKYRIRPGILPGTRETREAILEQQGRAEPGERKRCDACKRRLRADVISPIEVVPGLTIKLCPRCSMRFNDKWVFGLPKYR